MSRTRYQTCLIAAQLMLLTFVTSSCANKSIMKEFVSIRPAEFVDSISNIVYKNADGKNILLDIYSLKGDTAKNRPVVIYIHGGSWTGGDKSWIHFTSRQAIANAFVREHYVVVSINYRLADGKAYDFQTELSDCRDAIKWVRRNASKYNANPKEIGLWGTSAGAHLSLVCGYLPTDSTEVRFILDFYGPTNLHKMFHTDLSPIGLFAAKTAIPKLYQERQVLMKIFPRNFCDVYSPVNIADHNSTPTLILHGSKDKLVPIRQAYELEKVLTDNDAYHKMFIYPQLAHGFTRPSQQELDDMVKQSVDFAKKYFK
jgi:acetyl esterase/lipase